MANSPMYERLRAVAELNYDDLFERFDLLLARSSLSGAREQVSRAQNDPGISGTVKTAIAKRLNEDIATFGEYEDRLDRMRQRYEEARTAMLEAKKTFESLSPDLLSAFESGVLWFLEKIDWLGKILPVDEYLLEIEGLRNGRREQVAKEALERMNTRLTMLSLKDSITPGEEPGSVNPVSSPVGGPSRLGSDGILRSEPGYASYKDAQWPRDALDYPINAKMTADGPVGGYLPADVTNIDDPRWRSDYTSQALGPITGKAGITGGLLGAGTGLAARGLAGAGGAAGFGGLGPGALTGTTTGPTSPMTTVRGATGAGNSMMRPAMGMAGGHGGAGDPKKDKKPGLTGYEVVRLNDAEDGDQAPVDESRFGAGDVESLQPIDTNERDTW